MAFSADPSQQPVASVVGASAASTDSVAVVVVAVVGPTAGPGTIVLGPAVTGPVLGSLKGFSTEHYYSATVVIVSESAVGLELVVGPGLELVVDQASAAVPRPVAVGYQPVASVVAVIAVD